MEEDAGGAEQAWWLAEFFTPHLQGTKQGACYTCQL
jgi:hypothetical protein